MPVILLPLEESLLCLMAETFHREPDNDEIGPQMGLVLTGPQPPTPLV